MFGKAKRRTAVCWGTIVQNGRQGGSGTISVIVEFQANGVVYRFEEPLHMRCSAIKLGPIPIGQRWTPVLEHTNRGAAVVVCYDPADPTNAKMRDNVGGITVD
ncbi:hypothetical protein KIH77_02460 [Bifidobacterium sp. 82T24]|uniref:hypothetical protein n=1 Tax=Bifidobacterium pluvialisilvae TaxID=2834436 RepID=UPI001C57C886|nr:hypothetical protein [Bifidobacterium pluvialisilvae]MBW3087604.1 hypothetical protein [Bifidobacterium pluvialisilvae]